MNAAAGLSPPRRYVAIAAVSFGTILATVDSTIVAVALPTIARDLRVAPSAAVLIVTVYQLVLIMTLLPFSALGDRIGIRATYQLGQAVFIVATILCFFASNLPVLVAVRGLQALGAAAALSVSPALVRSIYPESRLGRGLSFNTAIAAASSTFAPTLGGIILTIASWPWLFASIIPFGVLSILIGWRALPSSQTHRTAFDWRGVIMCAGMFGLAVSGLDRLAQGYSPLLGMSLLGCGMVLGTVFIRRELRQARPVLPIDLLRHPSIALPTISAIAANVAMVSLILTLPFRLQQAYHFTPLEIGGVMAAWPMVVMFTAPASGALSDRVPGALLGSIGMAVATTGLISMMFLPVMPTHLDLVWRVALCGLGFGMFFAPNARGIIGRAPANRAAASGALVSTTRGVGQTLGATAVAAILAAGLATGPVPPLIATGCALLAGLSSAAVIWLPHHIIKPK